MVSVQIVGLSTPAPKLKDALEKLAFNMKKLGSPEKLDIFELIDSQLQYHIENQGKTKLTLEELEDILEKEGMGAKDGCPRKATVKVRELIARERKRVGKYMSPDEEPEYFEDALALIPDSEIYGVFQLDPPSDPQIEMEGLAPELQELLRAGGSSKSSAAALRDRSRSRSRSRVNEASPSKQPEEGESQPDSQDEVVSLREQGILARIDPNAIQQHLPILGKHPVGKRSNTKKIRGIGPDICRRLRRIGITDVSQIARMTEKIAEDVAKAIRYFPKRIQQDHWVWQAERIAAGKEWIVNPASDPKFARSGKSQYTTMTHIQYDRELLDIARHHSKDNSANLDKEVAECLWFSAMDGREITPTEKLTLRYIMNNNKFTEDATAFLTSKPEIGLQAVGA